MNVTLSIPNWLLILGVIVLIIWSVAGIAAYKAFKTMREKNRGETLNERFNRLRPPTNDHNDADWWKDE